MSIHEMDAVLSSSSENDLKKVLKFNGSEPILFKNSSHSVRLLEDLHSLRKNENFCDVRLKTDDHTIIYGHKNVLVAASPYFRAMFSRFTESINNLVDVVNIKRLDSSILLLLVDYIYTGKIIVTNENVQVLLLAANLLQLDYVNGICVEFLQTKMDTTNCLSINAFAELHDCMKLLSSSKEFINTHFLKLVGSDDFLSLSCKKLIDIISCNDLAVPSEEKIFESVIKWIQHDLDCRKEFLPELMEHVRLPLIASTPKILKNIISMPLLKNSPKFNDIVLEALHFNLLKSVQLFTIPQTIRCKPRQFGGLKKIIMLFNYFILHNKYKIYTEWYEPSTNQLKSGPGMKDCHVRGGLGVISSQFVFAMGGVHSTRSQSVSMLDASSPSPCWVSMVDMLVSRKKLGVGVVDDCIYAIGGIDGSTVLNSAEVFDVEIQNWRMVTSMITHRSSFGVGTLNNHLYAIGGFDGWNNLKSVECYNPTHDTWTLVEELAEPRYGVGIGVLEGVMYAVGGSNGSEYLKSVEAYRPSDGVWHFIADMHRRKYNPGVFALDGLLYVIGGVIGESKEPVKIIEVYNPITNTWSMKTLFCDDTALFAVSGVVVDRPPHFISN